MSKKILLVVVALFMSVVLAACGGNGDTSSDNGADTEDDSTDKTEDSSMDMDPSSSGEVPDELEKADDPKYPVNSKAEIKAGHMKGMVGAVGTIEGAYDTTAYVVTYKPTNGGEKVENHKWVIHEEMENAAKKPYEQGDEVVLEADHMEGMKGATAEIDSAEDTTVYMVSYKDTNTGEEIDNHKWVTEDELSSIE